MISDRRGDIGFAEAMIGAMTVCVVLMCFTAFVAADIALQDEGTVFDWTYISGVAYDGDYRIVYSSEIGSFIDLHGVSGVAVTLLDPITGEHILSDTFGHDSSIFRDERRIVHVDGTREQSFPMILEVRLFS